MSYADYWQRIQDHRQDLIAFARKLVQTPSLPGQEGLLAALLQEEMAHLEYDRVWVDAAGNVIGLVRGRNGPSLMLNGHMDHVDAGDPALWPQPPFGGEIQDQALWGRGSVDMKGALAAMVYAAGLVKGLDRPLPGDLYVAGVVQEEVGGLGARHLAGTLPVDRVVIGEASANHLRRGHRGRVELVVQFAGRAVHASMPDLGVNPHYSLARFLAGLRSMPMVQDETYGPSTVAPTRVCSQPQSTNVTPATLDLVLDWRNVPGETPAEIQARLEALLASSRESGCGGSINLATKELHTYTGLPMSYPDVFPSFATPADNPWLGQSQEVLTAALARRVEVGIWRFATDGGHFAAAGATVLGFGPGDDTLVHTAQERLPLDQLVESAVGYLALSLA
jgi:succinyl-diaminopimelate desuccinylase